MVFKLDAVDAYERKLVKQIEVAAASVEGGHNKAYLRLLSVSNRRGVITAKVEVDAQTATGVQRREITLQDGDDLEMTTGRAVYRDCRVGEIRVAKGDEFLELRFPGGEQYLRLGQAHGDVDEPQSVEGGLDGKGKKAMERMNPLCNLRYSATPKEAHHMVFKLDAVDA